MAIQEDIDGIKDVCVQAKILAGVRKTHSPSMGQVNVAKEKIKQEIQKIAKEIDNLNKGGLGF